MHVEAPPVWKVDGGDQILRLHGQIDAEERAARRDVLGGGDQIPRARPDPCLELHPAAGVLAASPKRVEIRPFHATI